MHLADAFIQSDLQLHSGYTFSLVCVPWESNPQPFALLTQCSTTEPHRNTNMVNELTWLICDDCSLTTITVFVVVAVKPWLICGDCGLTTITDFVVVAVKSWLICGDCDLTTITVL